MASDETGSASDTPGPVGGRDIGKDQWVEQSTVRTGGGAVDVMRHRLASIPVQWRVIAVGVVALLWALVSPTDYTTRIAFNVALYTLLATGLNVVVGWGGLLDLSYVAFFGFGAYAFGLLSSAKFDLHWPTLVSVPVIVLATAVLGYILGLPSRRLSGDYLAIVTLFFGQIFVSLANNGDRLQFSLGSKKFPAEAFNLTGGPNGVTGIDPLSVAGHKVTTITGYYVVTVIVAAVVISLLYRLRNARTGLAMRAMREDALAAEVLSVPVRRLRLVAFAMGAGIAGLAGTIFAATQLSVFGSNFDLPFLVLLYAATILGGLGNLGGGCIGALIVAVVPEMLRSPSTGRLLVYGALVLFVALRLRAWHRLSEFLATLLISAALARAGLALFGTSLKARSPGGLARVTGAFVPHLEHSVKFGNAAFLATIAGGLALTTIDPKWRPAAGGVVAYIGMLAWENRLAEQGSITRQLLIGAVLVGIMASRPHGFFGARRVEIL